MFTLYTTATSKKQRKISKMVATAFVIFALAMIAILVAGCSTPTVAADPTASQAAAPVEEVEAEVVVEDDGLYAFGETVSWADGISLSVSAPSEYEPSEYAAGVVEGQKTVVFEMVLTNNSDEKFEPIVFNTAASGGEEAPGVFDTGEDIGFPPTTVVLPGKTIKWNEAYSVADISDITLDVSVNFTNEAIFTN